MSGGRARAMRWTLALLALLLLVALGTYLAGEQTEVVVLRTFAEDGVPHETKLWVVDHDGVPWVRVANPQRQWYQRLRANPRAELVRAGVAQSVLGRPEPGAEAREAIERRFREKYGLVDWWYGVLLRRNPVPVRLEPLSEPSS